MPSPKEALNDYLQVVRSQLRLCKSIRTEDQEISRKPFKSGLFFNRGTSKLSTTMFASDPLALSPIPLKVGGRIELFLQAQLAGTGVKVMAYRIAFLEIPRNDNSISSLRFDLPGSAPSGIGWDNDLHDNPKHPKSHLHINFDGSTGANELRLAVGPVCPLALLRSFDHWYCKAFCV